MKTPKEDPKDKEARLRERRAAELERSSSVRRQARDLTGDIRRTFGTQISMFGMPSRTVGGGGVRPLSPSGAVRHPIANTFGIGKGSDRL